MEEMQQEKNKTPTTYSDHLLNRNIGFQPHMFIDATTHLFNREQLKLLDRGPTYVPPCQMRMSSPSIDNMGNGQLLAGQLLVRTLAR